MSTHAQEIWIKSDQDTIYRVHMKITAFLYIETALRNNTQLKPEIHECLCASFFRTFATNALPAIGHTLHMPQTPVIGRYCDRHRYHSSDSATIEPVVVKVRNVLERGVMSCDVIYKQRVEFTNSDTRLPIDEATGHLIWNGKENGDQSLRLVAMNVLSGLLRNLVDYAVTLRDGHLATWSLDVLA